MELLREECKKTISSENVNIFKECTRVIIAGTSYSGKSTICKDILIKYIEQIDYILLLASPGAQPLENEIKLVEKLTKFDYIPSISEINASFSKSAHKVIILDDNYTTAFQNENVLSYFIRGRHERLSIILISHNLFFSRARYSRDISLNVTHFILMKLRDVNQIFYLASQIYGKIEAKKVVKIYQYILENNSWPHMLLDLSINSKKITEFRSNIIHDHSIYKFETCYNILE